MMTIHKFPVEPGVFTVALPRHARVLSVQTQKGHPVMWVYLDDDPDLSTKEDRRFVAVGTGHNCEVVRNMRFVGTFQLDGGELIFHLFEGGSAG